MTEIGPAMIYATGLTLHHPLNPQGFRLFHSLFAQP